MRKINFELDCDLSELQRDNSSKIRSSIGMPLWWDMFNIFLERRKFLDRMIKI